MHGTITYDMPIIDRKSRLVMFGTASYVVFAAAVTWMASLRSGWISGAGLAIIPVLLLLPLVNALYTLHQLNKLERGKLITQPAADQLFRAALTQLSAGYVLAVALLPAFL